MNSTRSKLSLYWKCQLIGWSLTALFWSYQAYFQGNFSFGIALIHLVLDLGIGIGITHGYRLTVKKYHWLSAPIKQIAWRVIAAVVLMGGIYMLLVVFKNFSIQRLFTRGTDLRFGPYFNVFALPVWVTGVRLLAIWVLAYHLYHYALREIRISRENAQLNLLAKEAQMANLQAQLDPHFLFNSLNTIKALIADNPASARRAVDLLSELLRNSLYRKNEALISVEHELELIKDYLELEGLRFEERLSVQQTVAPRALMFKIPPLSIQTLVENAIKHGIDRQKAGGTVAIEINECGKNVIICVTNTGQINESPDGGIGLKNLNERLLLHYGAKATFNLVQKDHNTVTATLTIPAHA